MVVDRGHEAECLATAGTDRPDQVSHLGDDLAAVLAFPVEPLLVDLHRLGLSIAIGEEIEVPFPYGWPVARQAAEDGRLPVGAGAVEGRVGRERDFAVRTALGPR